MSFDDLFQHGVQRFLKEAFVPQKMLLFAHIPKCSGTSFLNALKQFFDNAWHFEYAKIDEQWELFLNRVTNEKQEPLDLAAGHFWHWHLNSLRENQVSRYGITFLRQPINRLVSEYRYMCTPAHPPSHEFIKECPTFDHFVDQRVQPNVIASILFNGVSSFDEYLDRLREDFAFIGLSEFYHLSMAILMKCLNKSYEVQHRDNVTVNTQQNRFQLSQQTYQRLAESQSLDIMLYEYLYKNYAAISDQFIGGMIDGSIK